MRHVAFIIPLLLVAAVRGQEPVETTVWLTILGEEGADEVTIGPEGGLLPYSLFVETDPIGTPGNFGLTRVAISIDTDLDVGQQPASELNPTFDVFFFGLTHRGQSVAPDDLRGIGGVQFITRPGVAFSTGFGQSGPAAVAHGDLIVRSASPGTEFHASILVDPDHPTLPTLTGIARGEFDRSGVISPPDHVIGTTLTIHVVPEPPSGALFLGSVVLLGAHWTRMARGREALVPLRESRARQRVNGCALRVGTVLALLATIGVLAPVGSSRAQDGGNSVFVDPRIDDALAESTEGGAYVIVRLADPVVRENVTFDEWLRLVSERQQEVLDGFAAGEFELTHRPPRAAGLSGRVNDVGLARLAAHLLVRAVHLNPMRPPPTIESPALSAATPSTLQKLTAQTAGGTPMGAGCLGVMRSLSATVSPLPAQTENLT